jgi:tetratricopeptide (TPR) repeat protein
MNLHRSGSRIPLYCLIVFLSIQPLSFTTIQNQTTRKSSEDEYLKALALIGDRKYENAVAGLKQIIRNDPDFSKAYVKIAEVYTYMNDPDEARRFFDAEIASHPRNPYARHGLGIIEREENEPDRARRYFTESLDLDPRYHGVYPDFIDSQQSLEAATEGIQKLLGADTGNAAAHYGMAYLHHKKVQKRQLIEESKRVMALDPDLVEIYGLASTSYYETGEYDSALQVCNKGIVLSGRKGDSENGIDLLRIKGDITNKLGKGAEALALMNEALQGAQRIGQKKEIAGVLRDFISYYWILCDYHEALKYAEQCLSLMRETNNPNGQAACLNYMGIFYGSLADYSKSLEYYQSAMELYKKTGAEISVAICLGNIGGSYVDIGDEQNALPLLEQSIRILEKSPYPKAVASYLGTLGEAYRRLGKTGEALKQYDRALQILKDLKTEEHQISFILCKIGNVYYEADNYPEALKYYEESLQINTKLFKEETRAGNLIGVGFLHLKMGHDDDARKCFENSLAMSRKIDRIDIVWRAESGLGSVCLKKGLLTDALLHFRRAVTAVEKMRGQLRLEEEKIGFLKDKTEAYAGLIDVLSLLHERDPRRGYDAEAFQCAESAKSRALLDIIQQGMIFDNLTAIHPEFRRKYVVNEKNLEEKHSELSEEFMKAEKNEQAGRMAALENEIVVLEREKSGLMEEMKGKYPEYYELTNPRSLDPKAIRSRVLKDGQLLAEYFVAEDKIYVWALTRTKFEFRTIALSRKSLESALGRISPLFARKKQGTNEKVDQKWANLRPDPLREFCKILLEEPLGPLIRDCNELIIVPDDLLCYFPFEILVDKIEGRQIHYLAESHPVSYAYSSGMLNPDLRRTRKAGGDLLAFGNPDFGTRPGKAIVDWIGSLGFLKPILRGDGFEPLPHAESEVRGIAPYFQHPSVFTGREATERCFKEKAPDFKIIHLATHHLTSDRQPMYSKIVLAQAEDGGEDGYLQTYEIYNLQLNADLVVLSGCGTGLGKLSRGEGLIGMSRAFLYAGAPSLVVSLWPVEDESTALLMKSFYAHLKQGMGKSEALQRAKIELIRTNASYSDPFFWGPFVLIGDWKALDF